MSDVFDLVRLERERQAEIWDGEHAWGSGDCSSQDVPDPVKAAVLAEEVGEVAHAMLEGDRLALRRELVQVAAVAVAWWEALAE
jgi:hypothetical protein